MGLSAAAIGAIKAISAGVAAVTAVGSAVYSYKSTMDANKAAEEAAEAENKRLNEEAIRQYGELDKAESDAIYESHASSLEAQKQLLQARSSVQLQAAVTGTYGNSVNIALQDIKTGFGGRMADIVQVRESQLDEVDQTAERIQHNTGASKVTAIKKPGFFKAINTGLNTYGKVKGITDSVGSAWESSQPVGEGATGKTTGPMTPAPNLTPTRGGYQRN